MSKYCTYCNPHTLHIVLLKQKAPKLLSTNTYCMYCSWPLCGSCSSLSFRECQTQLTCGIFQALGKNIGYIADQHGGVLIIWFWLCFFFCWTEIWQFSFLLNGNIFRLLNYNASRFLFLISWLKSIQVSCFWLVVVDYANISIVEHMSHLTKTSWSIRHCSHSWIGTIVPSCSVKKQLGFSLCIK